MTAGITRRTFLAGTAAATCGVTSLAADNTKPRFRYCAFVKFLQSLSFEQLAETIAEMGYDGIEATVRDKGQVLPERVEDDLPKLMDALRKYNLEITVMASSVNQVDQPHTEKVLRTAAALGVKRYRMAYYRYDMSRPVLEQLRELRPAVRDLVAMNRELGLSAVYQNHSGPSNVGAVVWDLQRLLRDYSPSEIGIAFDIRHATVEGGLAWPIHFNLAQPHLGAVYVKDFIWNGRKPKNVPLGDGQVDPAFFKVLKQSDFSGPVSVHVEYLGNAGVVENREALRKDLHKVRKLLE